jgi:hypothetical protein
MKAGIVAESTYERHAFSADIGQSETIMPRSRVSDNQGIEGRVYVVISISNWHLVVSA